MLPILRSTLRNHTVSVAGEPPSLVNDGKRLLTVAALGARLTNLDPLF